MSTLENLKKLGVSYKTISRTQAELDFPEVAELFPDEIIYANESIYNPPGIEFTEVVTPFLDYVVWRNPGDNLYHLVLQDSHIESKDFDFIINCIIIDEYRNDNYKIKIKKV